MKKLDKIGFILNIVLGAIYVPMSAFSWLMQMAAEAAIDATNPAYIGMINTFSVVSFIIPLLSAAGIVLSVILRKRGHSIPSLIVQLVPLLVFILNLVLLAVSEAFPPVI